MLVYQYTQMCQQCGRLPVIPTAICPSCGTRLSAPWTQQRSYPPSFPFPAPPSMYPLPLPPAPSQTNSTALLIEILLNCLGLYGVGWLIIGKTSRGVPLLIGSLVLWPLVGISIILTMGVGLFCVAPLAIGLMVWNRMLLQKATKGARW